MKKKDLDKAEKWTDAYKEHTYTNGWPKEWLHWSRKTHSKKQPPNNYRPITCLPMRWKILTAQIKEAIYFSRTSCRWFLEEQKGCCKGSGGTADLFYIDQHILNESKTRRKNLPMAGIDYKTAYYMFPQSWIINCLKMYKISDEVINFIEKTMKTWKVELTAGGEKLSWSEDPRRYISRRCTITITIHNCDDVT